MRIMVFPQIIAEDICKKLNMQSCNCAVISITDPGQPLADIKLGKAVKSIFRLSFYDLNTDFTSRDKSVFYPAAKEEDVIGLKEFVDSFQENGITTLIIHCGAGISRSAGVAAAVEEYLGLPNTIWRNDLYEPNYHVYRLALKEFGIYQDEERMNNVF